MIFIRVIFQIKEILLHIDYSTECRIFLNVRIIFTTPIDFCFFASFQVSSQKIFKHISYLQELIVNSYD